MNKGVLFMTVSMDMTALEQTMMQIMAATDLPEDDPYVVAAAMSCTDATYGQMMTGPAQMTEAQCCIAAWCRLFRCGSRPVDGRDVAFAMSAGSSPHARGAHARAVARLQVPGIIPACAGSTTSARFRPR